MVQTLVLYPAPGISHVISMVELGKLLLCHYPNCFSITIFLTTGFHQSPSLDSYIHSISQSYPSISFHSLPLVAFQPSSPNYLANFFQFIHLNAPHLASALTHLTKSSKIPALIIDFFCASAIPVASSLNIPCFYFITSGAAPLAVCAYFPKIHPQINANFKDLSLDLHIPGNPPLKAYHIMEPLLDRNDSIYWNMLHFCSQLPKSDGIIINTFRELEPVAIHAITDGACFPDTDAPPPAFYIGPLSVDRSGTEEEDKKTGEETECLRWLEKQPRGSVVYLCFGSRGSFSVSQLKEIAEALERSEQRFLWVVKKPPMDESAKQIMDTSSDFEVGSVLPSGFMERTKEKGMVVKSWVPQVEVLSKESVGGFVTHCGWNSVLEAVVAGVPMIAWPLYAEQHINRNELVEDMKMAIGLEHRKEDGFVSGDELEKKVRELMESERGREMRERSFKMKQMAASAMAADGSSKKDLNKLVERWNS